MEDLYPRILIKILNITDFQLSDEQKYFFNLKLGDQVLDSDTFSLKNMNKINKEFGKN